MSRHTYILVLALIACVGAALYYTYKDKQIRNHPQKYCYENFRGLKNNSNAVLVLTDIDLKDKYLRYYQQVEKGMEEPVYDNELEFLCLPQNKPVYVLGFSNDSLLAEVAYIGETSKYSPGRIEGWVYYKTIHDKPFEAAN